MHTEEVRKVALSNNHDKRLQTYDKTTTYPFGAGVGRMCKTELLGIGKNDILNRYKMINFNDYTNENKTKHNSNWPCIPDWSYRVLLTSCSGS